jgi:hypothetical protein
MRHCFYYETRECSNLYPTNLRNISWLQSLHGNVEYGHVGEEDAGNSAHTVRWIIDSGKKNQVFPE